MYGEDQSAMPLYDRYNAWNCFWWALHNSGTHLLNGEYRYPTNWQELKAQGKKYDMIRLMSVLALHANTCTQIKHNLKNYLKKFSGH
jgi:hypothetical protein